jgi:hypothetical protein
MVGILASILGGAMQGGGNAIQVQARDDELARQRERLDKIQADRQMAIEMMRERSRIESDQKQRDFTSEENKKNRDLQQSWRSADREEKSLDRQERSTDRAETQQFRREQLQQQSADRREAIAARLESTKIAREANRKQITLGDGTIGYTDGETFKPLKDAEGNPVKGQKDLDVRTQTYIKTLQEEMKDPLLSEDRRKALNTEIRGLLRGESGQTPQAAPWTGLDEGRRSAIVGRLESYRSGDPSRLAGAIEEARKLGVPVDILQNMTPKDKAPGVLGGQPKKPDFASEPTLTDSDRQLQQQMDADRSRKEQSASRANEIKSMTPEKIRSMPQDELRSFLDRFGISELSGRQRAAVNERMR